MGHFKDKRSVIGLVLVTMVLLVSCSSQSQKSSEFEIDSTSSGESESGSDEATTDFSEIEVVDYILFESSSGIYTFLVHLRNNSDFVADATGLFSVYDTNDTLIGQDDRESVTMLPGEDGLATGFVELEPLMDVSSLKLEYLIADVGFQKFSGENPVKASDVHLETDSYGCSVRGIVSNQFSEMKDSLQLRTIVLKDGKLYDGGFSYIQTVLPKKDSILDIRLERPQPCPTGNLTVLFLPNLGDDKIFNP
jgi:hypothetical protein